MKCTHDETEEVGAIWLKGNQCDALIPRPKPPAPQPGGSKTPRTDALGFKGFDPSYFTRHPNIGKAVDLCESLETELAAKQAEVDDWKRQAIEANMQRGKLKAEVERLRGALGAANKVIESFGDGIADIFDQLVKGDWIDPTPGSPVKNNVAMLHLQTVMREAMEYREKFPAAPTDKRGGEG